MPVSHAFHFQRSSFYPLVTHSSDTDAAALEREIDQQVYALYGLTPEAIALVEVTAP